MNEFLEKVVMGLVLILIIFSVLALGYLSYREVYGPRVDVGFRDACEHLGGKAAWNTQVFVCLK